MARKMVAASGRATYIFDRVRATSRRVCANRPCTCRSHREDLLVHRGGDPRGEACPPWRLSAEAHARHPGAPRHLHGCTFLLVRDQVVRRSRRSARSSAGLSPERGALSRPHRDDGHGFRRHRLPGRVLDANTEYCADGRAGLDEIRGTASSSGRPTTTGRGTTRPLPLRSDKAARNLAIDYVAPDGKITCVELNARSSTTTTAENSDDLPRHHGEEEAGDAADPGSEDGVRGAPGRGRGHDFNNMLNVINGYAEMALMRTDPSARLHHELEEILKAGLRSAALTSQLLPSPASRS